MPANLTELWQEHTNHEFVTRDEESTLATMVDDAYVNHVPVMTGGFGKTPLREFYARHTGIRLPYSNSSGF
jgi:carboxymethylenebutenolidase